MPTSYDVVAYPSMVFERTHPDRLAVFAVLHGLTPPPVETARVLEIGCGEGLNVTAFAAAYPRSRCEGFDLAETAIARGRDLAAAAGIGNVDLAVRNALDAKDAFAAGSFDYVIAHGVYAWVPEPVRAAIMDLIGHVLSPHGVAFVSYNSLPGGYFRMAMRDMLLHEVGEIADPEAKLAAAYAFLRNLAETEPKGHIAAEHFRLLAEDMLDSHGSVLFHDELGEVFAPQSLTDVVRAAEAADLRYLCDAEHVRLYEGFLEPGEDDRGDPDRTVLRKAQAVDFREACLFRMSLFVRSGQRPRRLLDPHAMADMWLSTELRWNEEEGQFLGGTTKHLKVSDDIMDAAFHRIADAGPGRLPVAGLIDDEQRRRIFLKLFAAGHVGLHTSPAPFVTHLSERPAASPLVRAELRDKRLRVSRLDHRALEIEQPHVRALLQAVDGTRTLSEIAQALDGLFPADEVEPALMAATRKALIQA